MSIIEELNNKMPKWMNTATKEYRAIWGKYPFTPLSNITKSSDYQCGAIANEMEYLVAYTDYVSKANDPEKLFAKYLDYLFQVFTGLNRFKNESDASVRNRLYSLFRRRMNSVWGTKWMVLDVVSYFFPRDELYVLENFVENNLVLNGRFENEISTEWQLQLSGNTVLQRSSENPFEESWAMQFIVDSNGNIASIYQTLTNISPGVYTLSFFVRSNVMQNVLNVSVKRTLDNKYYDFATGVWEDSDTGIILKASNRYEYKNLWILLDVQSDLVIKLSNMNVPEAVLDIDMIEFGERKSYPTFKLLARSTGGQAGGYLNLHYSSTDPEASTNYNKMSYIDIDHIGGTFTGITAQYLQEILDMIKPVGVKAMFDMVSVRR